MTLEEKVMADFKEAMKTKDQMRTQTISFLRSEMKYCAIEKKAEIGRASCRERVSSVV